MTVTTEEYPTREEATSAEREAIIGEKPRYNIANSTPRVRGRRVKLGSELTLRLADPTGSGRRPDVTRRVVDQLTTDIKNGACKPGDWLPTERVLTGRFKVSRQTVRRAVDILAAQGFVEIIPNQGPRVVGAGVLTERGFVEIHGSKGAAATGAAMLGLSDAEVRAINRQSLIAEFQ